MEGAITEWGPSNTQDIRQLRQEDSKVCVDTVAVEVLLPILSALTLLCRDKQCIAGKITHLACPSALLVSSGMPSADCCDIELARSRSYSFVPNVAISGVLTWIDENIAA
jgi:hypothetical protein